MLLLICLVVVGKRMNQCIYIFMCADYETIYVDTIQCSCVTRNDKLIGNKDMYVNVDFGFFTSKILRLACDVIICSLLFVWKMICRVQGCKYIRQSGVIQ